MDTENEHEDLCARCEEPFESPGDRTEDGFGNDYHNECKPEDEDDFLS